MAGSPWSAPFLWSEENTERLIELWQSGKTGSQISAILHITRNKVLGKLSRLGYLDGSRGTSPYNNEEIRMKAMHKRERIARAKMEKASKPSKGRVERVPLVAPSPPPLPEKRPSTWSGLAGEIDVLRPGDCRWPIGDPVETFCKAPAGADTYCPYHQEQATRPAGSPKELEEPTGKQQWR